MKKILVFTDLDGTLLNHYNYSWSDAVPALTTLDEKSCPVIFTSSKTTVEILQLKHAMNNHHPFISENGAIANIPDGYFENKQEIKEIEHYQPTYFAKPYQEIINLLNYLKKTYEYSFRGFNDIEIDELIALTGLSELQAKDAKQRQASEPFLWKGSEEAFTEFKIKLEKEGLIATSGGRFYHVMSDVNKGVTIKWMIKQYQAAEPGTEWVSVGLGDSYNDIQMLEAVDFPVFINNPGTKQPDLSSIPNLTETKLPGPLGWNKVVRDLVNEII